MVRSWWAGWWAALALLAVFAMHGLATHANATEPIPITAPVTAHHASHAASPHSHPSHQASADAAPVASLASFDGEGHDGGHHAMQVLGLCLAVLATAAIALLRLTRPTSGVLTVRARALRTAPAPVVARDLRPPDLHALSVLRC